jgi:hypothetical protein
MFVIINIDNLKILDTYEAETEDLTKIFWYGLNSIIPIVHLSLPENLDSACIKAALIDDVITLAEDADKIAAKAQAVKDVLIAAARARCDADIEAQQVAVYGTKLQTAAMRDYLTFEKMLTKPATYVGAMFSDEAAVIAFATPKVAASEAFSLWCIERIAQRNAEIAAL